MFADTARVTNFCIIIIIIIIIHYKHLQYMVVTGQFAD